MTLIKQVSGEDVMFVAGETSNIYQHVGILVVLDSSERPGFEIEQLREHFIERLSLIPHFRWRLHEVPLGLDRPYWVEDENFSFDHHLKRIALPGDGNMADLCEVAAHLYCKHLNRNRALWEIWLIEGLEGGKCAYLQKFHHCLMDGGGAMNMLDIITDPEPEPNAPKQVSKDISEARAGEVPTYSERSAKALQHLARLPGDAARSAFDMLRPKILEQLSWPRKPAAERPEVPHVCFNGAIGSDRALSFAALPVEDLKIVKNRFGVSLNDVVLALVSGAIRSYLQEYAEIPQESLRTNIPVSLRSEDDGHLSNRVTNTTVTLATNLEDPVARLEAINRDSRQSKKQVHEGAVSVLEIFQIMPPLLVSGLMQSLPDDQAAQYLGANLIVSNVRGSPQPMYLAGARMEKMYTMSILTAGVGINFTCVSYLGEMDFGIMVDPDMVPGYETIGARLTDAMAEYLALCRPVKKTRKKPAAGAGKKAARKKARAKNPQAKKAPAKKKPASRKTPASRRKGPDA